jgi:hypothetical protein
MGDDFRRRLTLFKDSLLAESRNSTGIMERRDILLHYHIFKNAGTTMDWILRRNFGGDFTEIHEAGEQGLLFSEEIIRFLVAHPQFKALSSHHFRLPPPRDDRFNIVEICFLRDPRDRIRSMYHYYRLIENPPEGSTASMVRGFSLPEFWVWLRDNQPFNAINPQTNLLGASGESLYPPSARHLAKAVARMKKIRMLGLVERFDDSMVVAEYCFLHAMFPGIDLSYDVQNVTVGRRATLAERLEKMRSDCGQDNFDEMTRLNQLDRQLVAAAERELDRRLAYVPNLAQRLEALHNRCVAHQQAASCKAA